MTTTTLGSDVDTVRTELAIGAMTCASCPARIERKLGKLDQVTAVVNLATETATVDHPRSPLGGGPRRGGRTGGLHRAARRRASAVEG